MSPTPLAFQDILRTVVLNKMSYSHVVCATEWDFERLYAEVKAMAAKSYVSLFCEWDFERLHAEVKAMAAKSYVSLPSGKNDPLTPITVGVRA